MISYGKHFIDNQDIREAIKSLKSDYITQGPNVSLFEKKLKKNSLLMLRLCLVVQLLYT